jgi:hypothetical protein
MCLWRDAQMSQNRRMQPPNGTALSRAGGTIRAPHPTPRRRSKKQERERLIRRTEALLVRGEDGVEQIAGALSIPRSTTHTNTPPLHP